MKLYKVLYLFMYLPCVFLRRVPFDIPRNLSEGLIFCCSEEEVQINRLRQPSAQRPTTQLIPTATSKNLLLYIPPDVVLLDYHGIHTSVAIRSRRPSERECLKNNKPLNGCMWFDQGGTPQKVCRNLVLSGTPASPGEFPYMAAIGFASGNETLWTCGGTLISKKFVLTAAHCAYSRQTRTSPSVVRLGAHNIKSAEDTTYDSGVANIVVHPNYTLTRKYHDIAILELASPLAILTNRIQIACLWQGFDFDFQGRPIALGWGSTTYPKYTKSNILLKGLLDIIPPQRCQGMIRPTKQFPQLTDDQVCALDLSGKPNNTVDTCQGDSGGPLLTTDSREAGFDLPYIIGITSFGKTCAGGSPGIYTRISSYVPWIESIVWNDTELKNWDELWD